MEKGANGAAAAVAERDMQVTIPAAEYSKLVIAEGKLEGLKQLYTMDIDDEMFRHITGKILGIVKEE